MIALARLLLRFVWLTIFILGIRRAVELAQRGAEELIDRIDEGEGDGLVRTLARLHDALHRNQGRQAGETDPTGEM